MLGLMNRFISVVDAVNYRVGRITMYGIFVLMGILLWWLITFLVDLIRSNLDPT